MWKLWTVTNINNITWSPTIKPGAQKKVKTNWMPEYTRMQTRKQNKTKQNGLAFALKKKKKTTNSSFT